MSLQHIREDEALLIEVDSNIGFTIWFLRDLDKFISDFQFSTE